MRSTSQPKGAFAIKIPARPTLGDLEELIGAIPAARQGAEIWLPSAIGPHFFSETRLAALVASVGASHQLTVVDWTPARSAASFYERFGEEVEGVSCLVNASKVVTAKKMASPLEPSELLKNIENRDGLLESQKRTTFTVCAIDDVMVRQPLAFAALSTKELFKTHLLERLAFAFSRVDQSARDTRRSQGESELAEIVYELFENAHQHGCLDANNEVIRGIRFLRIKRHIALSREEFVRRASGFPELVDYGMRCLPARQREGLRLFEIAIGDQGIGICSRFLATRSDYRTKGIAGDRPGLVNLIIEQALSSKLSQKGAGRGLRNALDAVRSLNGFISLRTENMWLYDSASVPCRSGTSPQFRSVHSESDLGRVSGTYLNVLIQV